MLFRNIFNNSKNNLYEYGLEVPFYLNIKNNIYSNEESYNLLRDELKDMIISFWNYNSLKDKINDSLIGKYIKDINVIINNNGTLTILLKTNKELSLDDKNNILLLINSIVKYYKELHYRNEIVLLYDKDKWYCKFI